MVKKDSRNRSGITAKEFLEERMKDPAFVARMEESERRIEENRARYREAARGVLADLAAAGFNVQAVQDLVAQFGRDHIPYEGAIPILIKWLPLVTYDALKEDIVRTLSVPWAKPTAVRPLLEEFKNTSSHENPLVGGVRWAIGNALWVLADDSIFNDLVQIAEYRQNGKSRQMVVLALGKMKVNKSQAIKALIGLLDDEEVNGHAVDALGKLKAQEALPLLERFLQHPKIWIRNEAKKAIRRIEQSKDRK